MLKSRLGFVVATAAFALLGGGGGCFTSPVNMRPQVVIHSQQTQVFRGQAAMFEATVIDDGQTPMPEWEFAPGMCPPNAKDPSTWVGGSVNEPEFMVLGGDTLSTFCVRARAIDAAGAVGIDAVSVPVGNHPPVAQIDVSAPMMITGTGFPVHTVFMLTAENSTDEDPADTPDTLSYKWILTINDTRAPDPTCPTDTSSFHACFTADVPGTFDVQLTVSDRDPGGTSTVIHRVFDVVPGQPPVAFLDIASPGPVGPYQLGTTFRLSAERSMDPDSQLDSPTFTITFPDGSPQGTEPCVGPASEFVRCFTAPVPGHYIAKVDVTSAGASASDSKPIDVMMDRLPCIGVTDPARAGNFPDVLVRTMSSPNNNMPYTFEIKTVDDDLDGGDAKSLNKSYFDWLVSVDGGPFTLRANAPMVSIPQNEFQIGSEVNLRLQIRDRNGDASNESFATCGATAPECHTTVGCFQRWTWVVRFQ